MSEQYIQTLSSLSLSLSLGQENRGGGDLDPANVEIQRTRVVSSCEYVSELLPVFSILFRRKWPRSRKLLLGLIVTPLKNSSRSYLYRNTTHSLILHRKKKTRIIPLNSTCLKYIIHSRATCFLIKIYKSNL